MINYGFKETLIRGFMVTRRTISISKGLELECDKGGGPKKKLLPGLTGLLSVDRTNFQLISVSRNFSIDRTDLLSIEHISYR